MESNEKMDSPFVRNLDKTTASMTPLSLNNLVLQLRPFMKKSKVAVTHKLVRQIKDLQKKRGPEEKKAKNLQKAERLGQEIDALKQINVDFVVKNALGNTKQLSDLGKETDAEARILLRLSCHKAIADPVTEWRKKHEDWKSLAAYLLSKNAARRYKKKIMKIEVKDANTKKGAKTKKREKQTPWEKKKTKSLADIVSVVGDGSSNLSAARQKDKASSDDKDNVKSKAKSGKLDRQQDRETPGSMAKVKLEQQATESVQNTASESDSNESDSDTNSDIILKSKQLHTKPPSKLPQQGQSDSDSESDSDTGSPSSEASDNKDNKDLEKEKIVDGGIRKSNDQLIAKKSTPPKKSALRTPDSGEDDSSEGSDNGEEEEDSETESQTAITPGTSKSQPHHKNSSNPSTNKERDGEMIVKKLNLDTLEQDTDIVVDESEPVDFLFEKAEPKSDTSQKPAKKKDMFFYHESGDESSAGPDSGNESNEDEVSDQDDMAVTMPLHESAFVGSLSKGSSSAGGHPKQYGNQNWKNNSFNTSKKSFDKNISRFGSDKFQSNRNAPQTFKDNRTDTRNQQTSRFPDKGKPKQWTNQPAPYTTGGKRTATDDDTSSLHPSWAASKKRKEQQSHIQAFVGKKTTFSDDDD